MRKVIVAVVTATVLSGTAFAQDPLILRGFGSQIGVSIRQADTGVAIEQVRTGTPAERAGFKAGDIVVEFDGERVRSTRQFTRLVEESRPDRPVAAVVMRDGARQTLTVTPEVARQGGVGLPEVFGNAERPYLRSLPEPGRNFDWPDLGITGSTRRLGAELAPLSDQLAGYFGVKDGALVSSVDRNSVAQDAGLRPGDVITAINGGAVGSPADVSQAIRSAPAGSSIEIRVMRDKKEVTLKAALPDTRPGGLRLNRIPI